MHSLWKKFHASLLTIGFGVRRLGEITAQTPQAAVQRTGLPDTATHAGIPGDREAIFNRSELMERLGNQEGLISGFISMFREAVDQDLPALEKAVMSEDLEAAGRYAHSIKGVAGNIGARRMYVVSVELDAYAKSGDMSNFKGRVAALRDEYEQFKAATAIM